MNLSKIKCGTCAFYQVDNSNYNERGAGQCRRNPDPHRKRGDEWCGEWRSEFPSPYEVTIKGETEDDLLKNLREVSGEPLVSRKPRDTETHRYDRLNGRLESIKALLQDVKGIRLEATSEGQLTRLFLDVCSRCEGIKIQVDEMERLLKES